MIGNCWNMKTAPYDTHAVLYSITHNGHVQIHIFIDT